MRLHLFPISQKVEKLPGKGALPHKRTGRMVLKRYLMRGMQFQIHLIRTYLKRFDGKRRHLLRQAGAGGDPPCRQIGGKTGQPFNRVREHGKRELRIILIAALALTNMRQKEPAADVFHPVPRALRLLVREENLRQIGIALDIQRRRPA